MLTFASSMSDAVSVDSSVGVMDGVDVTVTVTVTVCEEGMVGVIMVVMILSGHGPSKSP